jgi:putative colanic acid biosynthesis acetyltransferase WcaF
MIEESATIGWGAILYSVDRIHLGPRAIVSQGAHLCTASHDYNSETFDLETAPIVLEADAWVAAEAFVGPGVRLHSGAVVAARGVVTRSVPERAIVAGSPARRVGVRSITGRNHLR